MDIFICVIPAVLATTVWIITKQLEENHMKKNNDNKTRIRRVIFQIRPYEDHNTQFRSLGETTIDLWKSDGVDSATEERLRQSIKKKVKG